VRFFCRGGHVKKIARAARAGLFSRDKEIIIMQIGRKVTIFIEASPERPDETNGIWIRALLQARRAMRNSMIKYSRRANIMYPSCSFPNAIM